MMGGGSKGHNLPEGYTELAWIGSSGTQYMPIGLPPYSSNKYTFRFKCSPGDLTSAGNHVASLYYRTGGVVYRFYVLQASLTSGISYAYSTTVPVSQDTLVGEHEYQVELGPGLQRFYMDGVLLSETQQRIAIDRIPYELYLFAYREYITRYTQRNTNWYLNYFDVDVNGSPIRKFVPCRRDSDGKIGMYDLCGSISTRTNTPFYDNAGSDADFIAGPVI